MMTEERLAALKDFERLLSCRFEDVSILDNALTHRSFVNETLMTARRHKGG